MSKPDINHLYQRLIRSNERLLQLKELGAPAVLIQNEHRAFENAISDLTRDEDVGDFAEDIGAQTFSVSFEHIAGSTKPLTEDAFQFERLAEGH